MVQVFPFRAMRFDAARVDLASVTSPPHDCISPAEREAFLREPHSIVHVVLGQERPGDGEGPAAPSKAARAAECLAAWTQAGILSRDEGPAFYLYEITSGPPEDRRAMRCLIARVGLDPTYTDIRRHEKTLGRKKQERLRLREATQCDTEPIWLLYKDARGWIDEVLWSNSFDELARLTDEEGHEHRLWRVDRNEAVGEVQAQFEDRRLVIADGHHRYQTALDHFAATKQARHGSILACLVRESDEGMRILPTHRIVHGLSFGFEEAVEKARLHWEVAAATPDAQPAAGGREVILLGLSSGALRAVRLLLKPGSDVADGRGRLDTLAVTRAHERLLRDAWGIDLEHPERHLRFTRRTEEAVAGAGAGDLALLLPPESPEDVLAVASEGHVMPQKATYFVPKLRSGLVLSPLDGQ